MKKFIVAAFLVMGVATVGNAQSNLGNNTNNTTSSQQTITQRATAETNRWATELGLTTQQKTQLQVVNLDIEKQLDYIHSVGTAASPDRIVAINRQKNKRYEAILTATQYATYLQMQ
jgi:Spy/CpxP family protein refolding chaperone